MVDQNRNKFFQAYEQASYNTLTEGREGKKLPNDLFKALRKFMGEKDLPYYSLTANGVRFKQFVGAIQIGKYCIEVLPKVDRINNSDDAYKILISMLRQSGLIDIKTPSESNLRIKQNYILEAYTIMFLEECEMLIHRGLIKSYHNVSQNNNTLKGNLIFSKQLSKNLVHAEKFYVSFTTYDRQDPLNRILLKTLNLLAKLDTLSDNKSSVAKLKLYFPELDDIRVTDDFFSNIVWGRKNEAYRKAIHMARLLLLNYHPDLSSGKNDVLALMFDMNYLWEKWFTTKIRKAAALIDNRIEIKVQTRSSFWSDFNGETIHQKPDILLKLPCGSKIVIDTKWKLINKKPSEEDVRQMFTYNKLFDSNQAYLVYPGSNQSINGSFFKNSINGSCGMEFISFVKEGKLDSSGINAFFNRIVLLKKPAINN